MSLLTTTTTKTWEEKVESTGKLAISFSGGETSAYMTKKLLDKYAGSDIKVAVIFANTGLENEETLEFVRDCDRHLNFNTTWIEAVINPQHGKGSGARVVDFETANRDGAPFEAMIAKYGIPNVNFPHCSRVLKKHAIRAFLRLWGEYFTAIGIRADEFDRMSTDADKERLIYPFVEEGITKPDVNRYWSQQPFRLNLKGYQGNCKTCWKKSFRKLMTIAVENPRAFDFFRRMEVKYGNFRPESQPNRSLPANFFRENKTVDDIFAMAQQPFTPADDDSLNTIVYAQTNLFDFDVAIGLSSGRGESCEAF